MAITTTMVRGTQNTYDATTYTGGTRLLNQEIEDISEYMDSPERRDTKFLNTISKGSSRNQRVHKWGTQGVNQRNSTVGSGGITNSATTLPLATNEGIRFQQGSVLLLNDGTNKEIVHITAEPAASSATIKRARGGSGAVPGTTGYAFAQGATVTQIGIAMPEDADFPLGPVARGDQFWNTFQIFDTYVPHSWRSRNTPTYENKGDQLDYDVAQKAGDLKIDLEMAMIYGQRDLGTPDPAGKVGSTMSGLPHLVQLSGNVFNAGGALLGPSLFEQVFALLDDQYADYGTNIIGSLNSRMCWNRGLNSLRQATMRDTSADLTWEKISLTTGTYNFNHTKRWPNDSVFIYAPDECEYFAYEGGDWQQGDLATQGSVDKTYVYGDFSCRVDRPQTGYIITNFATTLSSYPSID